MKLIKIFSFTILFFVNSISAQESTYKEYENKKLSLEESVEMLTTLGSTIINSKEEKLRKENNQLFKKYLKKTIELDNSFEFDFSPIKTMSTIKSDDDKLKIYTWALPLNNNTYTYHGFVQIKLKKGFNIIELIDKVDKTSPYKYRPLYPQKWLGALYYKVLTNKVDDKIYYTVLGWDGNNNITTKKLIDVIQVKNDGNNIVFGAPIFELNANKKKEKTEKNTRYRRRAKPSPYRMIYEYASMVSMKLNWEKKEKYILMDHLSPLTSENEGFSGLKGPDLSFDAFKWKKGKWILLKDVKTKKYKKIPVRKIKEKTSPYQLKPNK